MAIMHVKAGLPDDIASEDNELHHYTTLAGLRGILATQTLWASYHSSLNDTTEMTSFRDALRRPLAEWLLRELPRSSISQTIDYPLSNGLGAPSAQLLEISRELLTLKMLWRRYRIRSSPAKQKQTLAVDPFIVSFCSHSSDSDYERQNGLLSQWRGYAAGGVCLVFDTKQLVRMLEAEAAAYNVIFGTAGRVVYSDDVVGLREICSNIAPIFGRALGINDPAESFWDSEIVQLCAWVGMVKHRAFKEEREFRITLTPATSRDMIISKKELSPNAGRIKEIKERAAQGRRIPYVSLFEGSSARLPIRRIIVGPSDSASKRMKEVGQIVGSEYQVTLSETPFR